MIQRSGCGSIRLKNDPDRSPHFLGSAIEPYESRLFETLDDIQGLC
ncbi:MAG: hypothetical protein R3B96_15545 [Pirellulaceae bacterium]